MKKIFRYLIPYTSISITIVLIMTSIFNLIEQNDTWYYSEWLFMIITVFVLYAIQFGVIEPYEFKTVIGYYLSVFAVWYIGLGVYLFGSKWMGLHVKNIVIYTIIMIIGFIVLRKYNQLYIRLQAEEINQKLKMQKTEKDTI